METQTVIPQIPLIKSTESFNLEISKDLKNKIELTCKHIWKDEWSGVLFFTHEGSFEEKNLKIRAIDMLVMDIGSSAFTDFELTPEIAGYIVDNPELLDAQMGLIHSHNNMETFFSTTDINTLKSEGQDRNHFVSLIVNNQGTYTAAITRTIKTINKGQSIMQYNSFDDMLYSSSRELEEESSYIEYYMLNVGFEDFEDSYTELKERLNFLQETKKQKFTAPTTYTNPIYQGNSVSYADIPSNKNFPQVNNKWWEENDKLDSKISYKYSKYKNKYKDIDVEENTSFNLEVNPTIVKNVVAQLITCSAIILDASKIDLDKWVNSMTSLYTKRFGYGEEGLKQFTLFAESFVEFLIYNIKDYKLEKTADSEEIVMAYAASIIRALEDFEDNKYLSVYIDALNSYTI